MIEVNQKEVLRVALEVIDKKRREAEDLIGVTLSSLEADLGVRVQEIFIRPRKNLAETSVWVQVDLGGFLVPRSNVDDVGGES